MHVLLVDDNPADRAAIDLLMTLHDLPVRTTADPEEAVGEVRAGAVSVLLLDMNYSARATSGAEGAALFRRVRALDPRVPVLLLTAFSSVEMAVRLIREGADDYVEKPWDDARLVEDVRRLHQLRTAGTRTEAPAVDPRGLVHASAAMAGVVALAARAAGAKIPVLITGPSGCGKERVADLVQANSPRRDGPYVRVNVAALPPDLVEAELFGVERGAYTGATARPGRFELADRGTLLLDEIGELSPRGQAALLRVLQSGELDRLGDTRTRRVDVRVICATNRDLRAAVRAGTFREDLLYRIAVFEIPVPPLAERPDDILVLARHFLPPHLRLSPSARRALLAHPWPGNVRELESCLQRGVLLADGELSAADLGLVAPDEVTDDVPGAPDGETERIEAAIRRADGVLAEAARELGLTRQALYRRMRRLAISVERRVRTDES